MASPLKERDSYLIDEGNDKKVYNRFGLLSSKALKNFNKRASNVLHVLQSHMSYLSVSSLLPVE